MKRDDRGNEMNKKKLSAKQERFCQEYLVDLNATQAAICAGYNKKTAYAIGHENLRKPKIQKRISEAMKKRQERTEITQDRVLRELALIGFSDLKNFIDIDENTGAIKAKGFDQMPGETSRALESINEDRVIKEDANGEQVTVYDKVKFKTYSKIRALELLGKHLDMFTDKVKLSGEVGVKYEISDKFMPKTKKSNGKKEK
jgi:phage terminase small subunit